MVNACVAFPANEISLSDAFQHILCATKSNIQELMDRLVQVGCSNAEPETERHTAVQAVWNEYDRAVQTADQLWRAAISPRFTPRVLVNGQQLSLGDQGWENRGPLYGVES